MLHQLVTLISGRNKARTESYRPNKKLTLLKHNKLSCYSLHSSIVGNRCVLTGKVCLVPPCLIPAGHFDLHKVSARYKYKRNFN